MRTRLTCVVARLIWRPFRARRRGTVFPGLKPRAEPSRPLWGEETSQIRLNFVPFSPGFTLGYALLAASGQGFPKSGNVPPGVEASR
jgi:hypothetical protein